MEKNFFEKIADFIRKIDPKSWPAFAMFVVVLSAAGTLNYVGMEPTFGALVAILVASFFGIGVLSWHIVESRTDDSEEQEQIAQVAKWITVGADAVLLVVNFIRIETQSYGWDIVAYIIIAIAAVTHVVGYLLWTQASQDRAINRELERNLSDIRRAGNRSNAVIKATEENLRVHKFVMEEEARLRDEYAALPKEMVDDLVEKMRTKAYEKLQDLGKEKAPKSARPASKPQTAPQNGQGSHKNASNFNAPLKTAVQYQKDAEGAELGEDPTKGRS